MDGSAIVPDAVYQVLKNDWHLEIPGMVSREAIVAALADRLAAMLQRDAEQFLQLMYRLDIAEHKLAAIAGNPEFPREVAALVYERQLQKAASRQAHRSNNNSNPEMGW